MVKMFVIVLKKINESKDWREMKVFGDDQAIIGYVAVNLAQEDDPRVVDKIFSVDSNANVTHHQIVFDGRLVLQEVHEPKGQRPSLEAAEDAEKFSGGNQ